jgi:hypothetical protein
MQAFAALRLGQERLDLVNKGNARTGEGHDGALAGGAVIIGVKAGRLKRHARVSRIVATLVGCPETTGL